MVLSPKKEQQLDKNDETLLIRKKQKIVKKYFELLFRLFKKLICLCFLGVLSNLFNSICFIQNFDWIYLFPFLYNLII